MTMEELQRQVGQLQAQIEALKTENASLKKKAETSQQEKEQAETSKTEAEKKAEKASADFAAYREQVEGERREARVSDLVKDGKVKPADKEKVLTFAAALASQGRSVDFAAPDGKSETISLEERYLRELEARPRDQRFAEFSTPPAHAGNDQPEWTPDDMVSKM